MPIRHRLRALTVAALALATGVSALPAAAAPQAPAAFGDGALKPSGDGLSAVIRYTEYGIPHIVGKDYASLGFGSGWAQAKDQVCVLADGFVTLRGERSRAFGPDGRPGGSLSSATTNLSSDLFFRGVRDAQTVEKLLERPAPAGPSRQAKELMRGWAAGYNAWLKQNKISDPACRGASWVTPVTAVDVARRGYAITVLGGQGLAADGLSGIGQQPKKSAAPARPTDPAAAARKVFDRQNADMGSNAVAFAGSATANGRGLLLGNPHYPWQGGRRFWQSQQTIPGELNVSGGSLLGMPIVEIGHNQHIAWSHTVATGVPLNLHELKTAPGDSHSYLVDGKPERMTKRTVTVPVRGADGRTSDVTRTQWWTRFGPVVTSLDDMPLPAADGTAYALNDPNAQSLRFLDSSLALSRSRSVRDIQQGLRRTQGLPWVNTIAADSAGHSLYTQSQVLPRVTDDLAGRCSTAFGRQTFPAAGLAVLDGSRGDCAPGRDADAVQDGIFGPSAMPTLLDAPYAENSNDSAWLANADRPLTGYPRIFGDTATSRSLRTRGGLQDVAAMAKRGRLTVADLERQQFANRAPAGALAAADAAKGCAALPGGRATGSDGTSVDVSAACGVLSRWDRTVAKDGKGALLFDRFWRRLVRTVPEDKLWRVPFSAASPVTTPNTLDTSADGFPRALADTVAELRAAGIALDAPLGEHQFVVRNGKRIPLSGGAHALGIWNMIEARWDASAGGYTDVAHGSSYIQAVGFDGGGCPVARTLLTYGQSSDPTSPHYSDQTELFSAGRMVRGRFCEKDILSSPKLKVVRVGER
ncbi:MULTISPECIES: penicillin acylase family protein [Streptomyces]|uniref:Penicillin acylase family protein n=1 Tax=Streptomyces griseocarneus TaxID=51201 RepID=A0ABX7RL17_9ACTN|nr:MULTISPECIES: penicillin acylase family protein [Streptomyces]QSY48627.1 penicillin acylase family protein [Streptomyces griseocarneus]